MFSFNSHKYNFWPIYETIVKYYPVGISKNNNKLYNFHKGIIELKNLIHDNLVDQENFQSRWKSFDNIIEDNINKKPIGTSGFSPSFSSLIEIEILDFENLTRIKRIHYLVSLLGPYYTIIGDDLNIIKVGEERLTNINYLVISPFNEFSGLFKILSTEIEKYFQNYRFVPFFILEQEINGLEVPFSDINTSSIFTALFNSQFDFSLPTFGDRQFKEELWITDDWDNSGEFIFYTNRP